MGQKCPTKRDLKGLLIENIGKIYIGQKCPKLGLHYFQNFHLPKKRLTINTQYRGCFASVPMSML